MDPTLNPKHSGKGVASPTSGSNLRSPSKQFEIRNHAAIMQRNQVKQDDVCGFACAKIFPRLSLVTGPVAREVRKWLDITKWSAWPIFFVLTNSYPAARVTRFQRW